MPRNSTAAVSPDVYTLTQQQDHVAVQVQILRGQEMPMPEMLSLRKPTAGKVRVCWFTTRLLWKPWELAM